MKTKVNSIRFWFQNEPVIAYVTLLNREYDLCFQVRYQSGLVKKFLPESQVQFSLVHGILSPASVCEQIEALVMSTSEALEKHWQLEALEIN